MSILELSITNPEDLDKVFKISDASSNPECKKFRSLYKTLMVWKSPLHIYMLDDLGFVAFTIGKRKNNMYEVCVREDVKQKGIGSQLFQFFLDNSKGKIKRWRTDERYDGYKFFTKKGYIPIKKEKHEFIYEVDDRVKNMAFSSQEIKQIVKDNTKKSKSLFDF